MNICYHYYFISCNASRNNDTGSLVYLNMFIIFLRDQKLLEIYSEMVIDN